MIDNYLNRSVSSSEFPNLIVDRELKILSFNKFTFDVIKASVGLEVKKGDSVLLFFLPENVDKAKLNLQTALNGHFVKDQLTFTAPDGSKEYSEYVFNPAFDEQGNVHSVSISSIDITELKNQEIALKKSEARYKGIVESQNDIILRMNLEGCYTFANNKFCEITGKTLNEIIGNNSLNFVHPDEIGLFESAFSQLRKPPFRISGEGRGLTKHGWRWFHWETVTVLNESGEPVEFQSICRDITENKNTHQKLSETNELLSAIMRSSPMAIVVFDFSGKITYWSRGAEKIFGWSESEVLNKENPTLLESDRDNFFSRLESLKKSNSLDLRNIERYRKDGSVVIMDAIGVPLRNESGQIIAALALYIDVTEKINAEIENLKLSSVLKLSMGAIAILNHNLEIESVNPKFSELTGYSLDELKRMTFKDIRSPQMTLEEYYKIENMIKSGTEWKSESINRSKGGNIYYENIIVSPIKDEYGVVCNYILIKEDISERSKALQELINTRLRLGTIMNSLPNLVIFEYVEGFTFISANIKDVIGYPREMFFENKEFFKSIFDKTDIDELSNKYFEWINSDTNDIFSCILRLKKPGNITAWANIFVSKTKNENSTVICGVVMDITESKESEEKLIWNETLLLAMTESTRYGYYAVDLLTGDILYINERFCEIWGISLIYSQILERKIKDAEVTAMCSRAVYDANHFRLTNIKYSDPANSITFEDEVDMVSGRILRRFSSLLRNSEGDYIGRFYLYEDITEKKLYERMSNMQNDYKLLIEESIDSMVITDIKGDIKVVNSKFCNLTGFAKNELITLSYFDLFVNPDESDILVYPQDSVDGKTVIRQKIIKRKDGTSINVETRSKMLPNKLIQIVLSEVDKTEAVVHTNAHDGILNIYVNILTKLRLFRHGENSLSCLNRISLFLKNPDYLMKTGSGGVTAEIKQRFFKLTEEFDSSVCPQLDHIVSIISNLIIDSPNVDFQTQLLNMKNDISVSAKMLKKNLFELNSKIRDEKSVLNLNALKNDILISINNIKSSIKIITGLLEKAYVTDAGESLKKIINKFTDTHANVDIKMDISATEQRIIFGSLDFSELINVLLVNSVEAARKKNIPLEIFISLSSEEGKTIISFTNNGKGIPADIKDKIFESGVTTKGKNRGFGLSFAGRIMKKYGGRITLDSSTEDGVKFLMELNPY